MSDHTAESLLTVMLHVAVGWMGLHLSAARADDLAAAIENRHPQMWKIRRFGK